MSVGDVEKLLAQLPSVRRVVLHGIGEPLLHPEIVEVVRLAAQNDRRVLFNTNARRLASEVIDGLLQGGLAELRVSIDAATPEAYRAVRVGGELDRVVENVRRVLARRDELGLRSPRVSLWMTGGADRIAELPLLVRLAADCGVEEVYLTRLVLSDQGSATGRERIFRRHDPATRSALAEAKALAEALGIRLWGAGDDAPDIAAWGTDEAPAPSRPWSICRRPYETAYVRVDGALLPCCIAPMIVSPVPAAWEMGNVFEAPFAEVWAGPAAEAFRDAFESDDPWSCCRRCGTEWSL